MSKKLKVSLIGIAAATLAVLSMPAVDAGYTHPTTTHPVYTTTTTQPTPTTCPDCTPGTVVFTTTTSVPVTTPQTVATTTTTTEVATSTTNQTTTSSSVETTSTTLSPSTTTATTTSSIAPSTTSSSTTTSLLPTTTSSSTSSTTTTGSSAPTSTAPSTTTSTTSTLPETFTFGAAGTVCVREVPTIRITFQNLFPSLAGQTGTLTMRDVNGIVVSTQSLVYQPGTTVDILYPGTSVNPDGSIADVPGWILNSDGFWVLDPSDAFLREGIFLTYEVNPTAGPVLVTYPPESSACANPNGPFPPPRLVPGELPPTL